MRVIAYDPYAEIDPAVDVEQVASLDELLAQADFVSLHARATKDNVNMFDAARFAKMREGAFFVNTARETLVDEDALDAALASGHLGGAALDVVRHSNDDGPAPLLAPPERRHDPAHRRRHPRDAAPGRGDDRRRDPALSPLVSRCVTSSTARRSAVSTDYLLAIDVGTGSARAVLFTPTAARRRSASASTATAKSPAWPARRCSTRRPTGR